MCDGHTGILQGKYNFRYPEVCGRIILKRNLKIWGVELWTNLISFKTGFTAFLL
jgi:hypothetical protein